MLHKSLGNVKSSYIVVFRVFFKFPLSFQNSFHFSMSTPFQPLRPAIMICVLNLLVTWIFLITHLIFNTLHIFAGPVSYKVQCQLQVSTPSGASIYLVHQNNMLRKWGEEDRRVCRGVDFVALRRLIQEAFLPRMRQRTRACFNT